MASEFERYRCVVQGHMVTITSWYDAEAEAWHSGAPAYSHLFTRPINDEAQFGSRKAAIDRAIHVLSGHFATN